MMAAHELTPAPVPAPHGVRTRAGRALAVLVLPASILPLLFLGPAMLRAPERVWIPAQPHAGRAGVARPAAAPARPRASLPAFPAQLSAPLAGPAPRPAVSAGSLSPTAVRR